MIRTLTAAALTVFATAASMAAAAYASSDMAGDNPMVGGAPMYAVKTIVQNAVNSQDHETLVAAVKAAGLVETLQGEGPFTVFAPTDEAFAALPDGVVEMVMMEENQAQLQTILTCHVVAESAMSDAIMGMIEDDGGAYPVETVGGCTLMARMDGDMITLEDENGRVATVTVADVRQSNGVIHVIDTVLLPAN